MTPQFICLECGELFDEPAKIIERHGLDSPPYEEMAVCPHCGGAFTRTIVCAACGEPITGDYVVLNQSRDCYCDACYTLRALGD